MEMNSEVRERKVGKKGREGRLETSREEMAHARVLNRNNHEAEVQEETRRDRELKKKKMCPEN